MEWDPNNNDCTAWIFHLPWDIWIPGVCKIFRGFKKIQFPSRIPHEIARIEFGSLVGEGVLNTSSKKVQADTLGLWKPWGGKAQYGQVGIRV